MLAVATVGQTALCVDVVARPIESQNRLAKVPRERPNAGGVTNRGRYSNGGSYGYIE
jgi:hypothetical protein